MTKIEAGDRVVATEDLGTRFWSTPVKKGDPGVVVEVRHSFWHGELFKVAFRDGEHTEDDVKEEAIAVIKKRQ